MKKKILTLTVILAAATLVVVFCGSAMAKVAGRCDNCHTMHASQSPWNPNWDADIEGNPQKYLLGKGCVGCHSHATDVTYTIGSVGAMSTVPVVYTVAAPLEYLAGGNFHWVAQGGATNDPKGHNVLGISGQDANITAADGAPGNPWDCTSSCHKTLAVEQTADANLGSGCEGCHLKPAHHADDHANLTGDFVDETGGWYRFLSGHMSGAGMGVEGYEHGEWENGQPNLTVGETGNHNQYVGFEGTHTASAGFYNLANTTTAYCCGCHGNFHIQDPTSRSGTLRDWTRHPSDAVIPNEAEYAAYTSYDPLSPVAMPLADVETLTGAVEPGTDMVMCLSCHRPHGSPYNDLLRWDYAASSAGGGDTNKGCFACHTLKDNP